MMPEEIYANLNGKTALITGASSGIGAALARRLGALGVNVVCTARTQSNLDIVAKSITDAGGSALAFAADATSPAGLVRAELGIGGETRIVEDYWNLVYTAVRHNLNVRYWVVLDPALEVPGVERAVVVVEVVVPDEIFDVVSVNYLDEEFRVIASPAVASVVRERRRQELPSGVHYRRGDVDAGAGRARHRREWELNIPRGNNQAKGSISSPGISN